MTEVHHITGRVDKKASGLCYAVPRICEALAKQERLAVTLHTTHSVPAESTGYKTISYSNWPVLDNVGIAPSMYGPLSEAAQAGQVIHNHSLWTMPNMFPGHLARRYDFPMIFSPHGTLAPWAMNHSRWKKRIFWRLGQELALTKASCFHASSEGEYEAIRSLGYRQPVALIPFGVDIPELEVFDATESPKALLFFARLHPAKGIELLISVWSRIQHDFPDWILRIAGPEDYPGYQDKIERLAESASCTRIEFLGPVFGTDKDRLLQGASLYVLPTHTENFGITVAEALAAETPAIVTKGAPWDGLVLHHCGWWIDRTERTVEQALREAMALPELEREAMGRRGRAWIAREFSWNTLGTQLASTYDWMLGKIQKPDWIIED